MYMLSCNLQFIKGSSCKLQRPTQWRPLQAALGKKTLSHNDTSSDVKVKRGSNDKRWEVTVSQEICNKSNANTRDINLGDLDSSLARSVNFPMRRGHVQFDQMTTRDVAQNGGRSSAWNQSRTPSRIIASGLSSFTGSAKFNSSRNNSGQMFRVEGCTSQQSCRICSGVVTPREDVLERRPNSTVPDVTDILLERADTWRDRLRSPIDSDNPLTIAPKRFQPKEDWQSFKPKFTKPFTFSYFSNTTHK